MKKKHSRKWSKAQRAKHAETIAARRALRAQPIGDRAPGPTLLFPDRTATPAPALAESNGNGSHVIDAHGVADLLDAIAMMRATGEGLIALANVLQRMDREHVGQFMKGFGFRFDMRAATDGTSPRPS